MRRWRTAAAAMLAGVLFGWGPGADAGGAPPVIDSVDATASWSGTFQDVVSPPLPELCAEVVCDEFRFAVSLPDDVWSDPGGVQVAVRWPDEANDLDLYVFGPSGDRVGQSDGFFASTSESVRIASAADGEYRVVVVPRFVEGAMGYEGFVEVEFAPAAEPIRDLLPNLVALPPGNLHLATGAYLFDPGVPGELASCYPEEQIEQGASRCLRFDQIIANHGDGALELRYRMDTVATDAQLRQRVFRSDGTRYDLVADTYELHPAHAHFHYRNFGQSRLWASNQDGERLGAEPLRTTRKNGFCMIDVENTRFGPGYRGEAPRTYYFPRCNAPTELEDGALYMVNGISVGWADVYNWFLADQFVEVSGLADGFYVLETVTDPNDTILEASNADNASSVHIRLCNGGTGAEIVGQGGCG